MALFAGMVSCYFTHTFNWWVCVIIGYGRLRKLLSINLAAAYEHAIPCCSTLLSAALALDEGTIALHALS